MLNRLVARPRRLALSFVALFALGAACDPARGESVLICPEGQVKNGLACLDRFDVALNGTGFLPAGQKRATYGSGTATFHLIDEAGDRVFTGQAQKSSLAGAVSGMGGEGGGGGETVGDPTPQPANGPYVADFSAFDTPGRYYLQVESGPRSPVFEIDERVYDEALEATILGLYGQRCDQSVHFAWHGESFAHGRCHTRDGRLDFSGVKTDDPTKDGRGGWHDAGDYGKYTVNGAFAVAILLKAWEHFPKKLEERAFPIPEEGGELPDLLDESKYQLDWLVKMQFDDGQVAHKLTALTFPGEVPPTSHGDARYFTTPSTAAAGDYVATLALAARVFEPFDPDYADALLAAATRSHEYLLDHPGHVNPQQDMFETGTYYDSNSEDERLWALVEYWETTGDDSLLERIEAGVAEMALRPNWDWPDTGNLSVYTYALSERPERDPQLVATVEKRIVEAADALASAAERHSYGRALDDYYWGSNGLVARVTMNFAVANLLSPQQRYEYAITQQVDHLLGRNPFARSYVTGVGYYPPRSPHHRPSITDTTESPWPGHLVGGPNGSATTWVDSKDDYQTNEIAINWTTSMAYALIAAM